MLQFGPDGYLYASVGDGDSGVVDPPGSSPRRGDDLLGDILRIDPRSGDPYAVPSDNPFVGVDGVAARDLGLRPPQPVAFLDRLRVREHVRRGRRRRAAREEST